MTQKNQSKKESDLAERIGELQEKREEIEKEILALKNQGEIAPDGCWIVRYRARGQGGTYWYYKWQSKQAIFITKKGNNSCHKYIGKAGSSAFMKAVEMMLRRTKIEALQQVQYTLDLGLMDLTGFALQGRGQRAFSRRENAPSPFPQMGLIPHRHTECSGSGGV